MRLEAIVFDLDGTLIDSFHDIASALNEVLAMIDVPAIPEYEVRTMIGGGVRALLLRALADGQKVDAAHGYFPKVYRRRMLETTALYPKVDRMLGRLAARKVPVLVATNKPSTFANPIVDHLGLPALGVRAVAGADEVANKKPDPAVVQLALRRAGLDQLDPSRVAYVGDMPIDRETAARFGGPFFGVGWGFDPAGLGPGMATDAEELAELLLGC